MKDKIQLNTILQRNESRFLGNPLGDETVLMDMDSGDYLGINSIGTIIWAYLKEPVSMQDIINKLLDAYNVSEDQCLKEVNAFIEKLDQQELLILHPQSK